MHRGNPIVKSATASSSDKKLTLGATRGNGASEEGKEDGEKFKCCQITKILHQGTSVRVNSSLLVTV